MVLKFPMVFVLIASLRFVHICSTYLVAPPLGG